MLRSKISGRNSPRLEMLVCKTKGNSAGAAEATVLRAKRWPTSASKGGVMPQIAVSRTVSSGNASLDASSLVNSFDFELFAGVGGKINFGERTDLVIDLGYSRGLSNIAASGVDGTGYNSSFALTAGLAFAL